MCLQGLMKVHHDLLKILNIKEKPKRRGRTDGQPDGKHENSIPPHKHSSRGV